MGIRPGLYDKGMPMKQTSLRLSSIHRNQLAKLAKKLQIDQANVIRLAITRLAEAEGILQQEPTKKHS
jgi:predicted DNA-binding protein